MSRTLSISANALDSYLIPIVNKRLASLTFKAESAQDDRYDELLATKNSALSEFERWRDNTEMRVIIGDDDYRSGHWHVPLSVMKRMKLSRLIYGLHALVSP